MSRLWLRGIQSTPARTGRFAARLCRSALSVIAGVVTAGACATDLSQLEKTGGEDASTPTFKPDVEDFPPPASNPPLGEPGPNFIEPRTTFAFTLVHGVVDAPLVFFCFAKADNSFVGKPRPSAGLGYGQALVLSELAGFNLAEEALNVFVVATSPEFAAKKSCAELLELAHSFEQENASDASVPGSEAGADAGADAEAGAASDAAAVDADTETAAVDADALDAGSGADAALDDAALGADASVPEPPLLRVAQLPQIPAGSLRSDRSSLLVAAGCIGAVGLVDPRQERACGAGYSPESPTLKPMLVTLSSVVAFDAPALQFLQASLAAGPLSLLSQPGETQGSSVTIANNVVDGQIAPVPPLRTVPLLSFGTPLSDAFLELSSSSQGTVRASWGDVLSIAGIDALEQGQGYTVVLLGPDPFFAGEGFWNPPIFTIVRNTPGAE